MEINERASLLIKASKAYYKGVPIMTDAEFDALEEELRQSDPTHSYFYQIHADGVKTYKHLQFMGSLEKAYSGEDISKFIQKVTKVGKTSLYLQPKIDGMSLGILYSEGRLSRIISRGKGLYGEDLTHNRCLLANVPESIPYKGLCEIRGEAFITDKDFSPIEKIFKNARNTVSSQMRAEKPHAKVKVTFLAYEIYGSDFSKYDYPLKLQTLIEWGYTIPNTKILKADYLCHIMDLIGTFSREMGGYQADGVVVGAVENSVMSALGLNAQNKPNHAIAYKFASLGATSTILSVEWSIGHNGRYSPVALIDPVKVSGSVISRASLHNMSYIRSKGFQIGSKVLVTKRGDTIPYLEEVLSGGDCPIKYPDFCYSCGRPLQENSSGMVFCENPSCASTTLSRLKGAVRRLNIKYMGDATVDALYKSGYIASIRDVLFLPESSYISVEGLGKKSFERYGTFRDKALEKITLPKLISAFCLKDLGEKSATKILQYLASKENLNYFQVLKNFKSPEITVPGVSHNAITSLYSLVNDFEDFFPLVKDLGLTSEVSLTFRGVVCVSGKHPSWGRKDIEKYVRSKGYDFTNTLTKEVTHFFYNPEDSSSKINKALKRDTESGFTCKPYEHLSEEIN